MSQPWVFTSPASRGVGLQLARRLLATTNAPIVATARGDLDGTRKRILQDMDVDKERLTVLELDVTDESTISSAASHCRSRFPSSSHYLHTAFCIPGILHPEKSPSQISAANALDTYKINALGPLLLMKHFSPALPKKATELPPQDSPGLQGLNPHSAIFAFMSARVGSISDNNLGGWYSYRSSKAAVNQIAKSLDIYLRNTAGENAMAVSLHPGTVKTGLSEEFWSSTPKEKLFTPEFAAESLIGVVGKLRKGDRGKCWDWEGKQIPP